MTQSITYVEAGKYQLQKTYSVQLPEFVDFHAVSRYISLSPAGVLTISEGYCWDGASGGFQTKSTMRASLVHDALYELIALELLPAEEVRDNADAVYRRLLEEDGAFALRAGWQWLAIRIFGGAYSKKPVRPVQVAP